MNPMAPRVQLRSPCSSAILGIGLASLFLLLQQSGEAAEAAAKSSSEKNPIMLIPERVFDAVDGAVHEGWAVEVTGQKITAAGPKSEVKPPANAATIQLPGMTLLPGLMDIHSHIFLHPYNEALWN